MNVEEKKKLSNKIGLTVLALIVLAFVGVKLYWRYDNWHNVGKTKIVLKEIAEGFTHNNKDIILKWASGGCKDAWGNQIVLTSSDEKGMTFVSKGPDGEIETSDDLSQFSDKPKEHKPLKLPELPELPEGVKAEKNESGWNFKLLWKKDK